MAISTGDARPLDRDSPMPLWAQLRDDLSRRLTLGEFDIAFPGEHDLVLEYAVSRHTVREALRRLREHGLLDTTRGRATQVRKDIEQPLGALYSLFREVEARGMEQASVVLVQEVTQHPAAAEQLELEAGADLFHLERIRLADGEPLAHDDVWLPAAPGAELLDVDFTHTALYDELATRAGIRLTGGNERISAVVPTLRERNLLAVPDDVACLRIQRTGRLAQTNFEFRVTVVRGDRYSVVADWSSKGYSVAASTQPAAARPGQS